MRIQLHALMLSVGMVLALSSISVAQETPTPIPLASYEVTGAVTGFNPQLGLIEIDGKEFLLADGVTVQSRVGGDPKDALAAGAEVGYVANENGDGRSIIVRLLVLSAPTANSAGH